MISLKKVTSEDVYDTIHNFVIQSGEAIVDYEGMVEIVLTMIKKAIALRWIAIYSEMQWNA